MTCVNWSLTVLGILIFVFAVWPGVGGDVLAQWVVGVSTVLILIISWTGVTCKPCAVKKENLKFKK